MNQVIKVTFMAALFLLLVSLLGCSELVINAPVEPKESPAPTEPAVAKQYTMEQAIDAARKLGEATDKEVVTTQSGLNYIILHEGEGNAATPGKQVTVHYTGWLPDGTKFDSSVDKNKPFSFLLGTGSVIKGWDEGVAGMKQGEKRKLIIPADLGYGSRSSGPIPPGSILIFDVELLKFD